MSAIRIAVRYAKSLIDLAAEQGKLEAVRADVDMLQSAVKNRDLYLLFKSPIVKPDQKNAILEKVFTGKLDVLTQAYLKLLVNKGREPFIPEIATEFIRQYKVLKHITTVHVTTASPLSEAFVTDLRKQIVATGATHENVDIILKTDASLIGGFVLDFDNKRYDASVAYKLEQLKTEFTKNLYIKEF
jgi:F-type H+-transporting ATPase subunit delta